MKIWGILKTFAWKVKKGDLKGNECRCGRIFDFKWENPEIDSLKSTQLNFPKQISLVSRYCVAFFRKVYKLFILSFKYRVNHIPRGVFIRFNE